MTTAAAASPRVIDAAAVPGALASLETITAQLEGAEAALAGYLEAKRRAFPRFYFVAPADLLDLLARGADARAAERHLPKLFDNVHRLKWKAAESGGGAPVSPSRLLIARARVRAAQRSVYAAAQRGGTRTQRRGTDDGAHRKLQYRITVPERKSPEGSHSGLTRVTWYRVGPGLRNGPSRPSVSVS
jgi:hypothetical protein